MASKGRNISKLEVDASGIVSADSLSSIVDAAPATLDTLNELAAALGDDANFATTTSTALGNMVVKNANIVAGTCTKITYDAKGLVTGSSALAQTDVTSALGAESITDNIDSKF